jgi:hypothetical protein
MNFQIPTTTEAALIQNFVQKYVTRIGPFMMKFIDMYFVDFEKRCNLILPEQLGISSVTGTLTASLIKTHNNLIEYLYIGEWQNGQKHGVGEMYMHTDVYIGEFQNDFLHGEIVHIDCLGVIYEGQFEHGSRSGYGLERFYGAAVPCHDGAYEGYWQYNIRNSNANDDHDDDFDFIPLPVLVRS